MKLIKVLFYVMMSCKFGFGYEWINWYYDLVYLCDLIIINGKEMYFLCYYDICLVELDFNFFEEVK